MHYLHSRKSEQRDNPWLRAILSRVLNFNYSVKHIHHIEHALILRPRLRDSISRWTYILDTHTEIITANVIIKNIHRHPAQEISFLLSNLRVQHVHLLKTWIPNGNPDIGNTQYTHSRTHCITLHELWTSHLVNTPYLIHASRPYSNIHVPPDLWLYTPVLSLKLIR